MRAFFLRRAVSRSSALVSAWRVERAAWSSSLGVVAEVRMEDVSGAV